MYYQNTIQINNMPCYDSKSFNISHTNLNNQPEPLQEQKSISNIKENLLYTLENLKESDVDELYRQRQPLVLKKLEKTITQEEETELKYIDWQLDRYEMAKYSEDFDRLESIVSNNKKAVDAILNSVGISYDK